MTDRYHAEYATVFGIPFETLQHNPRSSPVDPPTIHRVRGWRSRAAYRITFPCFDGYTSHLEGDRVSLDDTAILPFQFKTPPEPAPEAVPVRGPIGEERVVTGPEINDSFLRWQIAEQIMKRIADGLRPEETTARRWRPVQRFARYLAIVEQWLAHSDVIVTSADLRDPNRREQVASALLEVLRSEKGPHAIRGIPPRRGPVGRDASQWNFETQLRHTIPVARSEVDHAACHTQLEANIVRVLESHPAVAGFTRNHGPDRWEIPYRFNDRWARYVPDFIARSKAGGENACTLLIIEGKGKPDAKSEAKARWTQDAFLPAANAWERDEGRRRTWRFVEIGPQDSIHKTIGGSMSEGARTHAA